MYPKKKRPSISQLNRSRGYSEFIGDYSEMGELTHSASRRSLKNFTGGSRRLSSSKSTGNLSILDTLEKSIPQSHDEIGIKLYRMSLLHKREKQKMV